MSLILIHTSKRVCIVLKRRDNADIVKHIYGKVIDIIMNKKNLAASIEFCRSECKKLLDGGFPLETLIITESLRGIIKIQIRLYIRYLRIE